MDKIAHPVIEGTQGKPVTMDIYYSENNHLQPVIIFCHGFKGFKNWGHFDMVAKTFAIHDFAFVKFNFSHNGTTPEQPTDFADLEAFGNNNFLMELNELGMIIDYVDNNAAQYNIDKNKIYLIGHSRGGGISILKTAEDARIKKLCTWASVKDVSDFFIHQDIAQWKADGVIYTLNGRTHQNMPLYYQVYENYVQHKDRLDIPSALQNIKVPWLIVHGTNDSSVPYAFAEQLHAAHTGSQLLTIENADHTFGGKHPWTEEQLPSDTQSVVETCIQFFH